ncbi:MAG: hypothetical protein COA63_006755 [Methylophaga sp.]|nr:hypothetical protein [Methylophaga sp.]
MDKEDKTPPRWWHQDHKTWIKEVGQWQHESDRLVALLYQLECALPEHSAKLNNHVEGIQQHEGYLQRYEDGRLEFDSSEEQQQYHQNLAQLHGKMGQEHSGLKQMYADEMEKFRLLLNKLLCECDKRLSCECDKEA